MARSAARTSAALDAHARSTTGCSRISAGRWTPTCARSRRRSTSRSRTAAATSPIAGARRAAAQARPRRSSASTRTPRSRSRSTTSSSAWSRSRRSTRTARRRRRRRPTSRRSCARAALDLHGRTPNQTQYLKDIQAHDITFGIGPAGTGKTYLAVACAVDALERDAVKRIVLVRPAVEAGERLGFLPGDLAQKVDPYLRPLYDALYDLMGFDKVSKLFERQTIEIAPLAYMRGRTLNHSLHHPRRGAEHDARADEDVPHAHRLRHQGRDHRRRDADRPRARPEVAG